jgi:two-component system, LytTR family, sensor kinase
MPLDASPDVAAPATPLIGFGILWLVFWVLLTTGVVQDHLRQGGHELWEPLLQEGCSFVVASIIVSAQWHRSLGHDALLARPWAWLVHNSLIWLPAAAPAFVVSVYALRHAIYALLGETYVHESWGEVFIYEILKFSIFYLLFAGVIFGIRSHMVLSETRVRLERQRGLAKQAQLLQLTQQLAPHFLFNALNTIASTIHSDPELADSLLTRLSALLRAATDLARKPETLLEEELRMLEGYAAIMRQRFADRVSLSFEIEPQATACRVPTLVLQPLLENAFRHGVESHRGMTRIWVRAYLLNQRLHLVVENDTSELTADLALGVGLSNLQQRLLARYKEQASLSLDSRHDGGCIARIELPCAY